ncbi:hypothetical protein EVAR_60919_1 [Eumeta japonica]|uniref:Uncharacterized protein n=1 Tax=Eumeta variegata TaxID=151549 RepID=A0A4C1ZJY8_EUMVA|nr:hypothetical protein EVAR_60919_1 [Eumeta japonica]
MVWRHRHLRGGGSATEIVSSQVEGARFASAHGRVDRCVNNLYRMTTLVPRLGEHAEPFVVIILVTTIIGSLEDTQGPRMIIQSELKRLRRSTPRHLGGRGFLVDNISARARRTHRPAGARCRESIRPVISPRRPRPAVAATSSRRRARTIRRGNDSCSWSISYSYLKGRQRLNCSSGATYGFSRTTVVTSLPGGSNARLPLKMQCKKCIRTVLVIIEINHGGRRTAKHREKESGTRRTRENFDQTKITALSERWLLISLASHSGEVTGRAIATPPCTYLPLRARVVPKAKAKLSF